LTQQREKRGETWKVFMEQMCERSAQVDMIYKQQEDVLEKHYQVLGARLESGEQLRLSMNF